METKRLEELRKQRGMAIAKTSHIMRMADNEWAVPSQTRTGAYTVRIFQDKQTCSCPGLRRTRIKMQAHLRSGDKADFTNYKY